MVPSAPGASMKSVVALALFVVGCGDNLHPQEAPPDAPLPDAYAEAPHAAPPQVIPSGGAVMAAAKVIPVFFANDPAQATLEQFLAALAPSSYWTTVVGEYGVGPLTIAPSIVSTDTPPTTDTDLETWLEAQTDGTHPGWPTPDLTTLYTIFLPPGAVLTEGGAASCQAFGGYHSETMNGTIYALIPRCDSTGFDLTTGATSHELVEATTDPHPFTAPAYERLDPNYYVMNRTPGGELGDMCEYVDTAFAKLLGDFVVQRTWSNASAAAGHDPCVPAATPYLAAAPAMPEMLTLTTRAGTIMTPGVTINTGESKTIEVDLFSDGPSADFTVEAMDASVLQGSLTSLGFSWDRTTGHNGDKLMLTIKRLHTGTKRGNEIVIKAMKGTQSVSLWWGMVAGI